MTAFVGSGKIKIATQASGATFGARAFQDIGNASAFSFSFSENKKTLRDFQDPAGGLDASVTIIDAVTGTMDIRNFSAANLALALWGTTAALNATAIVGEAGKTIVPGIFIPTARLMNTTIPPVVKKGATVILAADYTYSAGGITIAAAITTAAVISGDAITIDYTPLIGADVQSLISSAPNVSIFFEGVNAVTGKYTSVRMYKVKLGAAQNLGMIGEDFATLSINFTLEKDTSIVSGSKFFAMEQAA